MSRLDDLLGGGLRPRSSFLVIGPSFSGKRVLQRSVLQDALGCGRPAVVVTTRKPADHYDEDAGGNTAGLQVTRQEAVFGDTRVRYVDAYSRRVGFNSSASNARLVEPVRLGAMVHAVNASLAEVHPDPGRERLLLVDSLTSLAAHNGIGQVYSFMEMLVGCAKAYRAVIHLCIDAQAHHGQEIALMRFLADNVLELKTDKGNRVLHLSGVDVDEDLPWIEYRYDKNKLEVVGSFSATRIR